MLRAAVVLYLLACLLASSLLAETESLNVVILGDSMALCGFGKRLDERFRTHASVQSTYTYMACGTTPMHWLKEGPYEKAKSRCGYWSIESQRGSQQPKVVEDVYGMTRGHTPAAHDVPKIEDLLASEKPNVLVIQNENNLFGIFGGRNTVQPQRDGPAVRRYISPFVAKLIHTPSSLRKIYWVGAPVSGRVSKEVQDFVLEQMRSAVGATGVVIDSRTLISYPYHHLEPDQEHFLGSQQEEWADHVFDAIEKDLNAHPLASAKLVNELPLPTGESSRITKAGENAPLIVKAKLVFKSQPMNLEALMPYQESLVTYVYDVRQVVRGQYSDKQILVAHPAHIGLKPQPLDRYKIGKTYKLQLQPLRSTPWNVAKTKDDTGLINLEPYIGLEDEAKYPGTAH